MILVLPKEVVPMIIFLNIMLLQVRVPVLSEKMY